MPGLPAARRPQRPAGEVWVWFESAMKGEDTDELARRRASSTSDSEAGFAKTSPAVHEHYDHYDEKMVRRLDQGWGYVDHWINREIEALLQPGTRVLDLGCGFASLSAHLNARGIPVAGLDMLPQCLAKARARYPGVSLIQGLVTQLPLGDGSVETVVFKDVLHHLFDEAPLDAVFSELERVGIEQVVVVDPNPNPFLLLGRRLIGHVDPVCSPQDASSLLERYGFEVTSIDYRIVTSLALSGGYVAPALVPGTRLAWGPLVALDSAVGKVLSRFRLAPCLCWRYFLTARRRRS